MNLIGIGIILVCILAALNGWRRGFMKSVISMLSVVAVLIIAMVLSPVLKSVIVKCTSWGEKTKEYYVEMIDDNMEEQADELAMEKQSDFIDGIGLPASFKEKLIENNDDVINEMLEVNGFSDYIASYLADAMLAVISFAISLIMAVIAVRLVSGVLNGFVNVPVISTFNKVAGLGLGIFKGVLYVWIFFLVVMAVSGTGWGGSVLQQIQKDIIARGFYENNLLVSLVI